MSQALFKRSLEIMERDFETTKSPTSSKAKKSNVKTKQKDSVMDLIPESQRLTCYIRDAKSKTKRKKIVDKTMRHDHFVYAMQ